MKLEVLRAVYGAQDGAHSLKQCSTFLPDQVQAKLIDTTDRLLPADINWKYYDLGYNVEDYYVISRTFPIQSTRPGMVETSVLCIRLSDIGASGKLQQLLDLLPAVPGEWKDTSPVHLDASEQGCGLLSEEELSPFVHRLVTGQPVIVAGTQSGIEVVKGIWCRLWAEARQNFSFGVASELNFDSSLKFDVSYVPEPLLSRWHGGHVLQVGSEVALNLGLAERELLYTNNNDSEFRRLKHLISDVSQLSRLERYLEFKHANTAEGMRAACRALARLMPLPSGAKEEKSTLLSELIRLTVAEGIDSLFGLRNFDGRAFENGFDVVSTAVRGYLLSSAASDPNSFRLAVSAFMDDQPWSAVVRGEIINFLLENPEERCALLWKWWEADGRLVDTITFPDDHLSAVARGLSKHCPKSIPANLGTSVCDYAIRCKAWDLLSDVVIASELPLKAKLKLAISVIDSKTRESLLSRLFLHGDSEQLLNSAVSIGDDTLVPFAAIVLGNHPALIEVCQPRVSIWRKIWADALRLRDSSLLHFAYGSVLVDEVIDLLVDGVAIDDVILLSLAPGMDLSGYDRRAEVWGSLPTVALETALTVTSVGWLQRFGLADPNAMSFPEKLLHAHVVRSFPAHVSELSERHVLHLFNSLLELGEAAFITWLHHRCNSRMPLENAAGVAHLIRERGWGDAARCILSAAQSRIPGFSHCLQLVSTLLTPIDLVSAAYASVIPAPREDLWWRAWEDVATDLYPRGIDQEDIWDRAAGKRSKVSGNTGDEQWRRGLRLLRQGGAGRRITIEGLLHQMRRDYNKNEALRIVEGGYKRWFSRK